MNTEKNNKMGFTLIELLVVVLIIGILSAIALPMYRKAVESSKVADALNTMQAVAKSEHGWYLNNNSYTKDFADLDIDLVDENGEKADGESYETVNYTFTLQDTAIRADRNNGEYTLYKLYEDGNIYCLPEEHAVCQQYGWGVNKQLCNGINGAWSNVKHKCYNTPQERCADNNENGATWQTSGYCGFYGVNGVEAGEFQECAGWSACQYSTFTGEGSKCFAGFQSSGCQYSHFYQGAECHVQCAYSTFTSGAICYSDIQEGCHGVTINENSKCISKLHSCENVIVNDGGQCITSEDSWRYACVGTYTGTGCCEGPKCPRNSPKCDCDIDPNTGMHKTSC